MADCVGKCRNGNRESGKSAVNREINRQYE